MNPRDFKNYLQFEAIFKQYYVELVVYVYTYTRTKQQAEDIVQQLLCELWEKRKVIAIHTDLKAFLFRSARNAAINFVNRRLKIFSELNENIASPCDPEEEMEAIHRDRLLYEIIEKLPEQRRRIFKSCYFDNKKYSETAHEFGISVNTVKTQMGRALRDLHKSIEELESEYNPQKS